MPRYYPHLGAFVLHHVQESNLISRACLTDHQGDRACSSGMELLQASSYSKATVLLASSLILCNKTTFLLDLKIIGSRPEVALWGADVRTTCGPTAHWSLYPDDHAWGCQKRCIQTTREGIMIEPIVVPFIWLILFLLIVIYLSLIHIWRCRRRG